VTSSSIADSVCQDRQTYALPPRANEHAERFLSQTLALLFPHFAPGASCSRSDVELEISNLGNDINALSRAFCGQAFDADLGRTFVDGLPELKRLLLLDATATLESDPAAKLMDEVILAYPGFFAIACHRIANVLYRQRLPVVPRLLNECAHRRTGIDIHPGATIGEAFSIDHGTGIVIGETATIGKRVRLYQGVTLGALSVEKRLAQRKRHPTLEDSVVVYANATILGGDTVVGAGSIIGGNVWLTKSVPPHSVVLHRAMDTRDVSEAPEFAFDYQI
jgi:serine O-acetyltransferase